MSSQETDNIGSDNDRGRGLLEFLDGVGATEGLGTLGVRLIPRRISSETAFIDWLKGEVADEDWVYATSRGDDDQLFGYALPARNGLVPSRQIVTGFPFIEMHSLLVAWWLTVAWRTRQLVNASQALIRESQMVPAASCVRALVETAAACWVDASKMADAWNDIKQHRASMFDAEDHKRRNAMMAILNEALMGSKFDDRAPDLQASYGWVKRTNVLSAVAKLSKAVEGQLQDDYQWLCNTVHPSLGNAFFFSGMHTRHDTGTHLLTHFFGRPTDFQPPTPMRRDVDWAVLNGFSVSVEVLHQTLDSALRVIDDVGLTSRAGAMSVFEYWRDFPIKDRKAPCPCRSGRRTSRCPHEWGHSGPAIPARFDGVQVPRR
jgi:hypothetical protein